jgi:hypothetical protein
MQKKTSMIMQDRRFFSRVYSYPKQLMNVHWKMIDQEYLKLCKHIHHRQQVQQDK